MCTCPSVGHRARDPQLAEQVRYLQQQVLGWKRRCETLEAEIRSLKSYEGYMHRSATTRIWPTLCTLWRSAREFHSVQHTVYFCTKFGHLFLTLLDCNSLQLLRCYMSLFVPYVHSLCTLCGCYMRTGGLSWSCFVSVSVCVVLGVSKKCVLHE